MVSHVSECVYKVSYQPNCTRLTVYCQRDSVRPSVHLSVCPSRSGICVQLNEYTIVRFSASGRTIPLVSGEVKFIRIFVGDHPQRGR